MNEREVVNNPAVASCARVVCPGHTHTGISSYLSNQARVRARTRRRPFTEAEVAAWRERGEYAAGKTDEDYLKLMRGVHLPGVATKADVMTFASRLFLYPELHSAPFCGRYRSCSFRDAIALVSEDPAVRLAAYLKIQPLMLFGQGHGDRMNGAVEAYAKFLTELARYKIPREELVKLLDDADAKLKGVLEE